MTAPTLEDILGDKQPVDEVRLVGDAPDSVLPLSEEQLLNEPSGNLFAMTQNAAMGWRPEDVGRPQYLIVSTQGGRALMAHPSLWATTPVIGRLACLFRKRPKRCVRPT